MSLTAFLADLRGELATIPKLRRAYDRVPDSINETPSILAYSRAYRFRLDTHGRGGGVYTYLAVHTIVIELHVSRKDLERDMELVEFFTDELPRHLYHAFITDRFAATLLTVGDPDLANNTAGDIRGQVVEGQWGSDQHIGHQIEFDVSMQEEVITGD